MAGTRWSPLAAGSRAPGVLGAGLGFGLGEVMNRRIPPKLPSSVQAFNKLRPAFEAWLLEHGSAIKQPTNPYEVIRFVGLKTECIIYRKANDTISNWSNGAAEAYRAFLDRTDWRACERGVRIDAKKANLISSLAKRDGWGCCFCPEVLTPETATTEHLLAVTSGGSSHMANLTLACRPCNTMVGHLSVREKIEMAIKGRSVAKPLKEIAA